MLSLFRSRTKFERTLFYIIVLISLILGSISVLSLVVAQRKFENLLQELWSKSAGDELQADLAYFAGKHLNDLSMENAELLKRASSDCRYGTADLLVDCVHDRLMATGTNDTAAVPLFLQLYAKADGGWRLAVERNLEASAQEARNSDVTGQDLQLKAADLDEFERTGVQPKHRRPGYLASLVYLERARRSNREPGVLALISSTDEALTERWQRSVRNVERPSFAPLFSQLIWMQISWLVVALSVVAIIAVVVSRVLSKRLSGPLADLVGAMEHVASGDLAFRAKPSGQQEFGFLIDSFNSMADSIQRLNEETRQTARMKRELEMGREIQLKLLPSVVPQPAGYDLYGTNVPSLELSGDYYDVLPWGSDGDLALILGDVSGKGLPAAMVMSNAQACLHSQALKPPSGLSDCVAILNRLILDSTDEITYITLFLAVLSPRQGKLAYVNGGHLPGLLLRPNGELLELERGGPIVGILPGIQFAANEIQLHAGDLLCLYTDGITEARSPDGEEFEKERLTRLLVENRDLSAQALSTRVIEAVRAYSGLEEQADDITIIVLKVLE